MFKLQDDPRYWWPVTVTQPNPENPGEAVESTFEVEFRWLDDQAHDEFIAKAHAERLNDRQALPEVMTGFRKVFGDDDQEVPSTPENLQRLIAQPVIGQKIQLATIIAQAYFASRREVLAKNSLEPLGHGSDAAPTMQ